MLGSNSYRPANIKQKRDQKTLKESTRNTQARLNLDHQQTNNPTASALLRTKTQKPLDCQLEAETKYHLFPNENAA